MDSPIQVDLGRIAQDLQIRRVQVESVVQLLDEGNTVPFITRYRKERTGNLNEVAVHEIQVRVGRLRELADRKETILKAVEAQGKLSEDLAAAIRAADNPKRLEDLYLPFKPKKKTKASDARERGLEPLALRVWNRDETLTDVAAAAAEFVNPEKGVETVAQVLEGVGHILAEAISELASVRDAVRRVVWKTGKVVTTKSEIPDGEGLEYRDYFDYSEPVGHIPPHRVLAINRGDKEGPLKVKLDVSRPEVEAALFAQLPLEDHPHAEVFRAAAVDALDRLLMPSLDREVRRDLTDMAERHAVDVFARNLRSLLLQPPIPTQVVLAIDPGFRTGCKIAVLDAHGNLLEHGVIHPHPPQNRRSESKVYLKDLVGKHHVTVVAIGNGTACRETEELVAEIIQEGTTFSTDPEAAAAAEARAVAAQAQAQAHAQRPAPAAPPAAASEAPEVPAVGAMTEAPAAEPAPAPEAEAEGEAAPAEAATPDAPAADVPAEAAPAPADAPPATAAETAGTTEEAPPPVSGGAPDEDLQAEEGVRSTPPEGHQADVDPGPGIVTPPDESRPEGPTAPTEDVEPGEPITTPPDEPAPPPPTAEPVAQGEGPGETPPPAEPAAPAPRTPAPPREPRVRTAPALTGATPPAGSPSGGPKPQRHEKHDQQRPPRPKSPPAPPRPHKADALLAQLSYVIVNEAGASVYSASPVGREEFPDFDATLRGTISIGRRLQDPLAELVKIEPQSIGVGLYQHDVNPKQLKESLESVISSCVNFVGVDLNTASVPLLRHVSGLNQLTARRVVDYRKEKGPFRNREQLKEVEGVGPVTYTQAAGFLKLREADDPLDQTWVHPESYPAATKLLETFGFTPDIVKDKDRLPELHAKLDEADVPALAQTLDVGELTLRDIFEALARPDRDPRDDLPKPIFKKGVLKLEDLEGGMELKGTVLNVVDFGAFVDIGLKDSGLVHISQLANRYIKSPHDVVSVGDVVTVWVMGVDQERKRVSLTMVQPGTERPRGGPGGPGGGGGGARRGEPRDARAPGGGGGGGGDRRGGGGGPGRPPRREGPAAAPPGPGGTAPPGEPRPGESTAPPPRTPAPGRSFGGGGGGGYGGQRGGPGGRGGPRPGGPGQGPGRFERAAQPPAKPVVRPAKPASPPPPLSKDALAGSVPLRTFGQLKQLWQARVDDPVEGEGGGEAPPESRGENQAPPEPPPAPPADAPTGEGPAG